MKFFTFMAGILLASSAFSQDAQTCGTREDEYFVEKGVEIQNFLVKQNPQHLVFKADFDRKSLPQVQITSESASFECWVRAVRGIWYADASKTGCYVAEIEWMPGADSSGCELEIQYPGLAKPIRASVYMSY